LVGDSTDVSITQILALVRFLNVKKKTVDRLFGIIEVTDGTSEGLFSLLAKRLKNTAFNVLTYRKRHGRRKDFFQGDHQR